jgi:hypothetical protein
MVWKDWAGADPVLPVQPTFAADWGLFNGPPQSTAFGAGECATSTRWTAGCFSPAYGLYGPMGLGLLGTSLWRQEALPSFRSLRNR